MDEKLRKVILQNHAAPVSTNKKMSLQIHLGIPLVKFKTWKLQGENRILFQTDKKIQIITLLLRVWEQNIRVSILLAVS